MNEFLHVITSTLFVASVLRVTTPILFAATGGLISELAGVPNISLEGSMLTGACAGALVAGYTHNVWLGVPAAVLGGMFIGLLLGVMHLEFGADPIIVGIGLNLLASGGTTFVVFGLLGDKSGTSSLGSRALPKLDLPLLSRIPVFGDIVSGQHLLTYAAFVMWGLSAVMVLRFRVGSHLRAVGEMDEAARSIGIDVKRIRYGAVVATGALAGMGGGFLSMGYVSYFARDMTAGRGFIAIAAIYLGGRRPVGTLLACLLFGLTEALAIRLGNFDIPSQLVSMIPYVATLVGLGFFAWRETSRARRLATGGAPRGEASARTPV